MFANPALRFSAHPSLYFPNELIHLEREALMVLISHLYVSARPGSEAEPGRCPVRWILAGRVVGYSPPLDAGSARSPRSQPPVCYYDQMLLHLCAAVCRARV